MNLAQKRNLSRPWLGALALLAYCAMLSFGGPARAQNYPDKLVRLVIPLAAGGATDVLARAIALRLTEVWKQPVIVENKAGANQIVGMEHVARSAPDGYTILLTGEGGITFNKYLYSKLPYDTLRDFVGIARVVQVHAFLAAPTSLPANNAKEFVELMKKDGPKMNYGSPGIGDPMHISMEWFKSVAKFDLAHIPYKGSAAALQGILSGDLQAIVTSGLSADQHIKAGKLKVIVASGKRRSPAYPDVQTLTEAGYPDVKFGYYLALLAPTGTPKPILQKVAADVQAIMNEPAFRAKYIEPYDAELITETPDAFAEFLKQDVLNAETKVKTSGAKLD